MAQVHVHPSLARFTDNQKQLELSISNVSTILSTLCEHYPALKASLMNTKGELTPYINIYINGKNLNQCIPHMPLHEHDKIDLVASLVGG